MFGELKPKRGVEALRHVVRAGYTPLVVGHVRDSVASLVPAEAIRAGPFHDDAELRAAYAGVRRRDPALFGAMGSPTWCSKRWRAAGWSSQPPVGGMPDVLVHGRTGFLVADDLALEAQLRSLRDVPCPEVGVAARAQAPTPAEEAERWEAVLVHASDA